jgi:hypothetical protein
LGEVASKIGLKKGVLQRPNAGPDAASDTVLLHHRVRSCVHQRVRSFLKFFVEISNRTLHRTRLCRPPRPVPATTTASGHLFKFFGQFVTGLCQRPIVHNRTRPIVHNQTRLVIPGAYWNATGRCLHRVRSFNHCVRSSREKRISPFLTVRLDLDPSSFSSATTRSRRIPSAACPPSCRDRVLLAEPPCHRRRAPLLAAALCRAVLARECTPGLRSASAARPQPPPRPRRSTAAAAPPEPPEPPEKSRALALAPPSWSLPAACAPSSEVLTHRRENPNPSHSICSPRLFARFSSPRLSPSLWSSPSPQGDIFSLD